MNQEELKVIAEQIQSKMVDSTNLESVGFDEDTSTLIIKFRNGRSYAYRPKNADWTDKLKEIHEKLVNPETISVGQYFQKEIAASTAWETTKLE